ncbi:Fanconi anemia group F protein [Alosa sapidissima]|uniref:Fanconi anemia group F protein n=1 Tax=Alosa sapidissima TaxID=34773 RepID=UPI001C09F8A5|nr:Fanconi anemia group F protein [Alosa sapidissima]
MEAILKNLESTSELIAISQTEYVKRWDEGTVERAFQWSDYCEHIYKRFNTNPTIRTAIENRLRQTNELLRRTFTEHRDFTFLDLGRCRDVLLCGRVPLKPRNAAFSSNIKGRGFIWCTLCAPIYSIHPCSKSLHQLWGQLLYSRLLGLSAGACGGNPRKSTNEEHISRRDTNYPPPAASRRCALQHLTQSALCI